MSSSFKTDSLHSAESEVGREPQSKLKYWLPPVIWMAAIFYFSTDSFSGENTGSIFYTIFHFFIPSLTLEQFQPIHFLIRKSAHFTEYGILAFLLFRAFRKGRIREWFWRSALSSWMILAGYALLDEFHQSFTKFRGSSIYDSLIDISGGTTALLLLWLASRRRKG